MATEPPNPKHKRRWFRFSLKAFVVVLTVFCVWLGALVFRVNKQKEAVQWVRDHGGRVLYDFQWDGILAPDPFAPDPGPNWLRDLIGVDYFGDITYIELADAKVGDIEPLRGLTQLRQLYLGGTQVTDLEPLYHLTQLQWLSLRETQVSDLEPLCELTKLKELVLCETQVSDLTPLLKIKGVTIYLNEGQQVTVPEELKDRVVRLQP